MTVIEEHILTTRFSNNKVRRSFVCRWYHKETGNWQINEFADDELKLVTKVKENELGFKGK